MSGSPLLKVLVERDDVDVIHLSREEREAWRGWKCDGFKDDQLVAPDQFYEEFELFIRHIADYIGNKAKWMRGDTGEEITAWDAITILADVGKWYPREYKKEI